MLYQKWKYSKFLFNKKHKFSRDYILRCLPSDLLRDSYRTISKWKGYSPTPLLNLNKLNKELNLNNIFYKDESKRFHLKSFKALGGAYAVEKISKLGKKITVSSATAGNHGKSVAWGASRLKLKCKIFVSQYVSQTRINEIKKFGAQVIRVKGSYEDSLIECQKQSKKNNWKLFKMFRQTTTSIFRNLLWQDILLWLKKSLSKLINILLIYFFKQVLEG